MRQFFQISILIICHCLWANTAIAEKEGYQEKEGDILQLAIPATVYATTFFMDDHEGRNQFYKSFFTNIGVVTALKYGAHRDRPDRGDNHAFPSGHTAIAFQGAAFIQQRYGWQYSMPIYVVGTYVGWSRVHARQHYTRDVVAGAAIGLVISYYFTTPLSRDITIAPMVGDGVYGITLYGEF